MRPTRRDFLLGSAAVGAASSLTGLARAAIDQAADLPKIVLPPPIAPAERVARVRRAQAGMRARGMGAVLIEAGPSLDYFTGVQWWRSERLTGVVIPVEGDPVIVTPFFEKPSVAETLAIPAEIRTWDEHDEPLRLVADFVRSRNLQRLPVGMEETNRYFLVDRLQRQLPGAAIVSANPIVRALRMRKSATEIALMQAAADVTMAAYRYSWPRVKEGMSPADIGALMSQATLSLGGRVEFNLVLLGEASAYPHGTGKAQAVKRGEIVLMDCGCTVHGYQSDISRTFVWGADPTVDQRRVYDQVIRGQQIALRAAQIGRPAGSVDDAVRAAYTAWGYGPDYKLPGLSHRTGHGIGMEGHEPVNLVRGETTPLAVGMCFSNEPGIYLPGKFGVRLEDCFYMTPQGPRYFSRPPAGLDRPV